MGNKVYASERGREDDFGHGIHFFGKQPHTPEEWGNIIPLIRLERGSVATEIGFTMSKNGAIKISHRAQYHRLDNLSIYVATAPLFDPSPIQGQGPRQAYRKFPPPFCGEA